ncbi:hypothetical protein [Reichenbachiella versicolor]|uniref:hypothetical protein n=1 Tax=Reichenbachiella versicolor TaxID=1821036 RepID=UPI0013A59BDD|nr:hypothetical protein [Reichenbachiella versicolor]
MTKYKLKIVLATIFCMQLFHSTQAQEIPEETSLSKKEIRRQIPSYINLQFGLGVSYFRDFATSPLFYSGLTSHTAVSRYKENQDLFKNYGFSFSSGAYYNVYNDHEAVSLVRSMSLYYEYLRSINRWLPSSNIDWKVGGTINVTSNLRINESLLNNGVGFEMIPTLFASFRGTKDISRKKEVEKKIWFLKIKKRPKTRSLTGQFNIGLVNSQYRNGFAYADQSALLNDPKIFGGYEFKVFSGIRAMGSFQYTRYLKNHNAIRYSYTWEAYRTGDRDPLEMVHHVLKMTLLFNTNNKGR